MLGNKPGAPFPISSGELLPNEWSFRTGVLPADCVHPDLAELEDTALLGVRGLVSGSIPSAEVLVTNLSRTPFRRRSFAVVVGDESSVAALLEDVLRQLTDKLSLPG